MKKNRIIWLDFARCFAILSVLVVHSVESGYTLKFEDLGGLPFLSALFRVVGFTAGRLGVPIFLTISGYLLLDRDFSDSERIIKFYKTNLLPLLLTVEIWIVIYYLLQVTIEGQQFVFKHFIDNMLFLRTNEYSHFWYMPMIIGMYIAIPFVSRAVKGLETKTLAVPFAVILFVIFTVRTINTYYSMFDVELISPQIDTAFLGGIYGAYLMVGLLCKRGAFRKIPSAVLIFGFMLSAAFCCFTLLFTVKKGYDYHLWYDFLGIFIAAVCLFELFSRIEPKNKSKASVRFANAASLLSRLSFGIYLIHKPVLNVCRTFLRAYITSRSALSVAVFAATFAVSFAAAFIISKIPKVRKWLLLVK